MIKKNFWLKLKAWQKGAIIVIVLHMIFSFVIMYETRYGNNFGIEEVPATIIFYFTDFPAFLLMSNLEIVFEGIIPLSINNCFVVSDCSFFGMMIVYMIFVIISSTYYGVIGVIIGKIFEFIYDIFKKF